MFYSIIDYTSQLCYFLNMKKKTIFDLFEEQQQQEMAKQPPAADRMPGEEPAQEEPDAEEAAEEEPENAEPEQQTERGSDDGIQHATE